MLQQGTVSMTMAQITTREQGGTSLVGAAAKRPCDVQGLCRRGCAPHWLQGSREPAPPFTGSQLSGDQTLHLVQVAQQSWPSGLWLREREKASPAILLPGGGIGWGWGCEGSLSSFPSPPEVRELAQPLTGCITRENGPYALAGQHSGSWLWRHES